MEPWWSQPLSHLSVVGATKVVVVGVVGGAGVVQVEAGAAVLLAW